MRPEMYESHTPMSLGACSLPSWVSDSDVTDRPNQRVYLLGPECLARRQELRLLP